MVGCKLLPKPLSSLKGTSKADQLVPSRWKYCIGRNKQYRVSPHHLMLIFLRSEYLVPTHRFGNRFLKKCWHHQFNILKVMHPGAKAEQLFFQGRQERGNAYSVDCVANLHQQTSFYCLGLFQSMQHFSSNCQLLFNMTKLLLV